MTQKARIVNEELIVKGYKFNLRNYDNFDLAESEVRNLRNKNKITAKQYRDSLFLLKDYFNE